MRIRFIETFSTTRELFLRGSIHEIEPEQAQGLVRAGLAEPADIPQASPQAAAVDPPARKAGRK